MRGRKVADTAGGKLGKVDAVICITADAVYVSQAQWPGARVPSDDPTLVDELDVGDIYGG
jgi:hypothetical protein